MQFMCLIFEVEQAWSNTYSNEVLGKQQVLFILHIDNFVCNYAAWPVVSKSGYVVILMSFSSINYST